MMRRLLLSLLVIILGCAAQPVLAAPEMDSIAGLSVAVWLPKESKAKKTPVIIFSHGFHGCNTQSSFLMEGLANAGYAVFAPNHQDAACGSLLKQLQAPQVAFEDAETWTSDVYRDRTKDIVKLLNALEDEPRFGTLDLQHVGMAGHSLGGYTSLVIAGAWPAWKDGRIKAVLAMSPYCEPFLYHNTLERMDVPVMYQGGTSDPDFTPSMIKGDGAYSLSSSPKFYIEFDKANHFSWTDRHNIAHDSMVTYSVAFFDHYLKNLPFPSELVTPQKDVTRVIADFKR